MLRRGSWICLFLLAPSGCGGHASYTDASGGASGGDVGTGGSTTGGSVGSGGTGSGGTPFGGSGGSFVDPGCPDAGGPEPNWECDPLGGAEECGGDPFACTPYLTYPSDDSGCGEPEYGAFCSVAGTATQGESCDTTTCAAGYLCVVGAKPGARCARMCSLAATNDCPAGLVCGPTDIEGIGVCI